MSKRRFNKFGIPGGSTVIVPDNVAGGPALWFDAGFTDYGDETLMTTWADRSANGLDATTEGIWRPIYRKDVINGLPAVVFDGIDDFMTITTGGVSLGTIIAVCNSSADGDDLFERFNGLFAGATTDTMVIADQGLTQLRAGSQGVGSEVWINNVKTLEYAPLTDMKLLSAVWDGTPPTPTNLVMCRDKDSGSRTWGGCVAEILIWNTVLSVTDRELVEQYMSNKYNLGLTIV